MTCSDSRCAIDTRVAALRVRDSRPISGMPEPRSSASCGVVSATGFCAVNWPRIEPAVGAELASGVPKSAVLT